MFIYIIKSHFSSFHYPIHPHLANPVHVSSCSYLSCLTAYKAHIQLVMCHQTLIKDLRHLLHISLLMLESLCQWVHFGTMCTPSNSRASTMCTTSRNPVHCATSMALSWSVTWSFSAKWKPIVSVTSSSSYRWDKLRWVIWVISSLTMLNVFLQDSISTVSDLSSASCSLGQPSFLNYSGQLIDILDIPTTASHSRLAATRSEQLPSVGPRNIMVFIYPLVCLIDVNFLIGSRDWCHSNLRTERHDSYWTCHHKHCSCHPSCSKIYATCYWSFCCKTCESGLWHWWATVLWCCNWSIRINYSCGDTAGGNWFELPILLKPRLLPCHSCTYY